MNIGCPLWVLNFWRTPNVSQTSTLGWKDSSPVGIYKTRWWFQTFFIFNPIWGRFLIWRAYFSNGLVQPPTRKALAFFLTTWNQPVKTGMRFATDQGRVPSCCDLVSGGVEQYLGFATKKGCPLWFCSFKELLEGHYHITMLWTCWNFRSEMNESWYVLGNP